MHEGEALDWFLNTGCKVAQPRGIISFLGCPIDVKIKLRHPRIEAKFLMDKVCKRVFYWSNRLLSLQGRIVLVEHVLNAIPIYHLMAMTHIGCVSGDGTDLSRFFMGTW